MGGDPLEGGIVHFGTIICLVRNGTEDYEGDLVAVCGVSDGCAFHFGTQTLGAGDNLLLQGLFGDELVTAGNPADFCVTGIYSFRCSIGIIYQGFVGRADNAAKDTA